MHNMSIAGRASIQYDSCMKKSWILAVAAAILSLGIFWTPFLLKIDRFWGIDFSHRNMQTIVTNFDGINFLVVAKSLYDPQQIELDYASILSGRKNLYFSAHYPGFPLLIKAFDLVTTGPNALLMAIVVANILLGLGLYWFFKLVTKNEKTALYLTIIGLFFPARMLAMRGVGSNESLFMFFVLTSLITTSKEKPWLSAVLGSLAVITRSPGILLFVSYISAIWVGGGAVKLKLKQTIPYLLIPLTLCGLWVYYGIVFKDFLAYFKVGGNINLYFPPFMVFASHFDWVSGMWLEDIIYNYLFYGIGIGLFIKNFSSRNEAFKKIGYFGAIYLATIPFIVHRDIARYALPIAPIAIAGISPLIESKYFKYGLLILIIPIFLFSWNFILNNVQPIMDWSALL